MYAFLDIVLWNHDIKVLLRDSDHDGVAIKDNVVARRLLLGTKMHRQEQEVAMLSGCQRSFFFHIAVMRKFLHRIAFQIEIGF